MSLLDIRVLGDPILRQETKPVTVMTDELRRLVDDMFETMHAAKGIGLAAPQVGRTERIAVVDVDKSPLVIVNPEIILANGPRERAEEGCLSIPDIFGEVERPMNIVVRALDRNGLPIEVPGADLLARCLQHEIDHLHGKVFIDYLSLLKKKAAVRKWEDMKVKYPSLRRSLTAAEVAEHHNDDAL